MNEENQLGQIRKIMWGDPDYPLRLYEIPDPPQQLYVLGRLPKEDRPAAAVIGARDCSEYGKLVARELGRTLALRGVQVISGMARGIDGIAQKAALEAGGLSMGVLGSGVDVCYPKQNRDIYDALILKGGVISEYAPGTPPIAKLFPPRNRIVAGLSDVLIVVEARKKSGTLITVDLALDQGKDVYAVPGRLFDGLSEGCNRLIQNGAGMITDIDHFVDDFFGDKILPKEDNRGHDITLKTAGIIPAELSAGEQFVLQAMDITPRSFEEIYAAIGQMNREDNPIKNQNELLKSCMDLCVKGLIISEVPGYFALQIQN